MDTKARTALADRSMEQRKKQMSRKGSPGCCSNNHTRRCCKATGLIGGVLTLLGILLLVGGKDFFEEKILQSMELSSGGKREASWLVPPVQAYLSGYGFNVTNPEAVARGEKPNLTEIGPFVYKAVTIKDSINHTDGKSHLVYNDDGKTLTYRPRKFYYLDRSKSIGDPDTTFITVPNVPLLTGFGVIRDMSWVVKPAGVWKLLGQGRATPFINVSFSGLLWGYEDAMPCMKMDTPEGCDSSDTPNTPDSDNTDNEEGGSDDWEKDDDWKRKKRAARYKRETNEGETYPELNLPDIDLRTADFSAMEKPKGGFVDCKCNWGLFRDRNVTLRKPLKIHHGQANLSMKGWVDEFDGKKTFGWWEKGSKCDEVGGQDTSTLPPGWTPESVVDFYTPLMGRRIKLNYEKDTEHLGLQSHRYIPDEKQFAHPDENEENRCYCVEPFSCLKSGVYNMEPFKRTPDRPTGAPIALSYPHFYQADPSFSEAVIGMKPEKEKHEFYMDIAPKFGFPLAIRPRFQLNAIMRKDTGISVMENFVDELVLPFLWAQDGFDEPSEEMANAIKLGLKVPGLAVVFGAIFLCLGLGMIALALLWVLWQRRLQQPVTEVYPLS